jgi:hypothetical protein
MTDNIAIAEGYTREVYGFADGCDLCLLVKPNTFLDGRFKAWDTDGQRWVKVNGWLFSFEDCE